MLHSGLWIGRHYPYDDVGIVPVRCPVRSEENRIGNTVCTIWEPFILDDEEASLVRVVDGLVAEFPEQVRKRKRKSVSDFIECFCFVFVFVGCLFVMPCGIEFLREAMKGNHDECRVGVAVESDSEF